MGCAGALPVSGKEGIFTGRWSQVRCERGARLPEYSRNPLSALIRRVFLKAGCRERNPVYGGQAGVSE